MNFLKGRGHAKWYVSIYECLYDKAVMIGMELDQKI